MTRPSALVLDGEEVKLRLQAERSRTKSHVHVDWVRFTVLRRNVPFVPVEVLFPSSDSVWDEGTRAARIANVLREIPDAEFDAAAQALDLAEEVSAALGSDYAVAPEVRKGHDFYRFRWAIERCGSEVGWVGFLSSGDSPRQAAQSRTLHCNLFGAACTFASPGWTDRIASIVEDRNGDVTRCDLALDFFSGFAGGMQRVLDDYKAGLCDVGGRRLKCNMVGDWANDHERSFYFGSKEAGKQTNVYEKGDQLFGVDAANPWLRIETRFGNKLRILPADMLRRPADFFAGASDWHAAMLRESDAQVIPESIRTTPRLALQTVRAEVSRNVRWTLTTAKASLAALFAYAPDTAFLEAVTHARPPGRLQKFSAAELRRAFEDCFSTVAGHSPACA